MPRLLSAAKRRQANMSEAEIKDLFDAVLRSVAKALVGKDDVTELVFTALVAGGHVLIEDVPGTGKTTLVTALARSLDMSFSRIQFTPDVLPSDVTGYTVLDIKTGERSLVRGPIMNNMVLADEINRTSPKTQSALLEVMQEGQVTVDGQTLKVPQPFMVLATQNPVEHVGTYPLPEAQLDRFMMKISVGYPTREQETQILSSRRAGDPSETITPVAKADDVLTLRRARTQITCAPPVLEYIVQIAEATRRDERIALGISPRGSLALADAAAARAMLHGRSFVLPDDVQALAMPVLAHRIVTSVRNNPSKESSASLLRGIMRSLRVPAVS
ncbi:MAG: MoxR family ATPase [Clostridiales bacterium]|nr:MoxR family ATPase [Clostridiales bacterium]